MSQSKLETMTQKHSPVFFNEQQKNKTGLRGKIIIQEAGQKTGGPLRQQANSLQKA